MKLRGRFGPTLLATMMVVLGGCSSGGGGGPTGSGGAGGTTGGGGTQGGGGNGGSSTGSGGSVSDGGVDVPIVPEEPLCPRNGPIVAGSTPLPDGVELVSSADDVEFLTVTDSYAYWANETKIFRAPVAGGGGETVVVDRTASRNHIEGIAIGDDGFVYWSDSGINGALGVTRAPADGSGGPTSVIAGNSYQHVVVADGFVYSNDLGSREIVRAPGTGGARTVLAREVFPSKMAVAAGYLWVIHPYINEISNVNLLPDPVATVAPSPDAGVAGDGGINVPPGAERVTPVSNFHNDGVTADATHVFYDDDAKAMRVPIAGGTPNIVRKIPDTSDIFGTVTHYMGAVVPYAGSVYWAPESSGCEPLFKSSGDGAVHTPYVQKIFGPWLLAVNATHVYMAVRGQVLRVPRPQ